MSVRTMARVWELSRHRGNDLLMLLAIADFADDDGKAYPSVNTLARKCRILGRGANKVLASLRGSGELEIRQNEGPNGTNLYRIVLSTHPLSKRTPLVQMDTLSKWTTPPVQMDPNPLSKWTDKPSVNRQQPSTHVDSKAADPCPHDQIIDLYHRALPTGRRVKIWNESRRAKLRNRWREDAKRQALTWWEKFFSYVAESDFLSGRACTPGRPPFEIDLEWLVSPHNFVKVVEGKYHRDISS